MGCRRDYRNLTQAERDRFVAALYHVKSTGIVDSFADLHDIHFTHGHQNSSFLPWHREFIRRFEAELQAFDPRVSLCYWNSSDDQSTSSGLWNSAFLGQFNGAWSLGRSVGSGGSLASPMTVDQVLGLGSYDVFWPDLESRVHNGPHNWVGGQMASAASPHDPVFFLHHCYIDMLWAQWQLRNPGAAFVASAGAPDVGDAMHPWSTTVGDVLDHRLINIYDYPGGFIRDSVRITPPPATPPTITFAAVPTGMTFLGSASFHADACETLAFDVAQPVVDSGPPGSAFSRLAASVTVDPHVEPVGRVWISFTGTAAGDHATGHVDVTCPQTGESWRVPLVADSIAPTKAVIALVLDQSNSMTFDSGIAPGVNRAQVLRFSAAPFVEVLDDDHAAFVIGFDHDAHLLQGFTPTDLAGRLGLSGTITGTYSPNPNGWTAIGEAVKFAHDQLAPVTGYDVKATVVLTDGEENHGPHQRLSLGDVEGLIDGHVFAIGLGAPHAIKAEALTALCDGHKGYMLITGELTPDSTFRLAKYYQQIASGVTNQEIVLDPDGWVNDGDIVRIPFLLTEADITARAVLLTDQPYGVLFALESPAGDVIHVSNPHPMVEHRIGTANQMYRVGLPIPLDQGDAHAGKWHVLLARRGRGHSLARDSAMGGLAAGKGAARYSVSVHAMSNLRMRAMLNQTSFEPGAVVHVTTALTEYGVALEGTSSVRVEIERPDASQFVLALTNGTGATSSGSFVASQAGVYRCRILASGTTRRGRPFTREGTRTAAVRAGGDRPPKDPSPPRDGIVCHVLRCLLDDRGVETLLREHSVDVDRLRRCVADACDPQTVHQDRGAAFDLRSLLPSSVWAAVEAAVSQRLPIR